MPHSAFPLPLARSRRRDLLGLAPRHRHLSSHRKPIRGTGSLQGASQTLCRSQRPSARSLRFFAFRLRFCAAGDCASASFSIWRIEGVKRGFEPAIPRVGCRGMVKKVNLFGQLIGAFLGSFGSAVGSWAKEEPKRVGCMCKQLHQSIHALSSSKPSLSVRPSCTLGICLALRCALCWLTLVPLLLRICPFLLLG